MHAHCKAASILARAACLAGIAVVGGGANHSTTAAISQTRSRHTADVLPPTQGRRVPRWREQPNAASRQARLASAKGAQRTFIPPTSSDHPPLALPITIAFDLPIVNAGPDNGDPFSHLTEGGFGRNGHNGIGNGGCCQGIGDSQSGPPGLSVHRGCGVMPPQMVYKVEPEFSEEARKAKHQGVVVLTIEVDSTGNVRNIKVRQSLGLGLDGILDGKPVTTEATVPVNFQRL